MRCCTQITRRAERLLIPAILIFRRSGTLLRHPEKRVFPVITRESRTRFRLALNNLQHRDNAFKFNVLQSRQCVSRDAANERMYIFVTVTPSASRKKTFAEENSLDLSTSPLPICVTDTLRWHALINGTCPFAIPPPHSLSFSRDLVYSRRSRTGCP